MDLAAEHSIADVRCVAGELSFTACVGGLEERIHFRTGSELTPGADAAIAACLMPAMRQGGTLAMAEPVSPRLLRGVREFEATQRAWSLGWEFGPPLHEVEVRAPAARRPPRPPTGRVAAFFSGGVDSWSTVLDNPDLTDLIFVRGIDLLPSASHQTGLAEKVEARLREVAAKLGLGFHAVDTNVRELSDPLVPWEAYFACPLIASALLFEPLFDRVLIAGDTDYATQDPRGGNRLVCRLWSTERLEVADDGGRRNRQQRTELIADHPLVHESLRVCWENPGGAYNCGTCSKCLMTMASLEAIGKRELVKTFPPAFDLEALARSEVYQAASLTLREDVLDAAVAAGDRPQLVAALESALVRGRRDLGIPAGRRQRPDPVPTEAHPLEQEIAELRSAPGEASFEARIGGESRRIWFRGDIPATAPADAALAACLMPAMRHGGTLAMAEPVSPRLLRGAREYEAIQRAWSQGWKIGAGPLRELDLQVPAGEPRRKQPTGRVAAFFSGGVDSFALLDSEPDVTDAIFVRGADILSGLPHQANLADEVEPRLRQAASELGLELHVIETNVRELSDPLAPWEAYFACPLIAVALLLEPLFDRVLIAGDTDYATQLLIDYGAIWNVERLWSTEALEICDWGGRLNREQRHRLVVDDPVAQRTLRVCWQNRGGAYNCGRCQKCSRSMLSFEAWGVRERMLTFPPELDLEAVAALEIHQMIEVVEWEDTLETVRAAGRRDLERAVEPIVASGKRALGLPAGYRTRAGALPPLRPTLRSRLAQSLARWTARAPQT